MTVEEAAKQVNVSKDTARKGRAIVQSGDSDLIAMVDAGKMSINAAAKKVQAKKPKQERPKKLTRAPAARPTPNDEPVDAPVGCAADLDPAAGVDDPGSTNKPVGAPPAPEGAAEELPVPEGAVDEPATALEPAGTQSKSQMGPATAAVWAMIVVVPIQSVDMLRSRNPVPSRCTPPPRRTTE
jgi:hypothetical protein